MASVDGDDKGQSIYDILTSDATGKLETVRGIKRDVSEFHFAPVDEHPVELNDLATTLWRTMGYMLWAADETRTNQQELARQFQSLYDAIAAFRVTMLKADPAIPQRLEQYQKALFDDIHGTFEALQNQDTAGGLKPEDLPPALRNRFVGVSGKKFRVLVFPKKDIWQRENQEEFIRELRSVIPPDRVTGTPVQLLEYETLLKNSYEHAALYALGAIALMVLFHFRSCSACCWRCCRWPSAPPGWRG